MALILFGGSFDPIHNAHIRIAKAALNEVGGKVIFIPAKNPRWKITEEKEIDRLNMLFGALKEIDEKNFQIDTLELKRSEKEISYSIDTVRHYKNLYPNEELYFLMGGDEVNRFRNWKNAEEIASLANIIFVSRPGITLNKEDITFFNMRQLSYMEKDNVSSSSVRLLHNIDVPKFVLNYIEEHKLYYVRKLEERLTPHRLKHSLSVAHLAEEIIRRNNLPLLNKGYTAGCLHDLGKYLPLEEAKKLMNQYYPELDFEKIPQFAIHQYTSAILAKKLFFIEDEMILEAIVCHCLGKANMSPLAKILYASDKIEPTRGYDSSSLIEASCQNYENGFLEVLKANKEFLENKEKGKEAKPNYSKECFDYYLKKGN